MKQLQDKVALVTGASSGIGRAAALLFARQGARVVATARRRPELEALVGAIAEEGGEAVACAGDVTDEAHVAAAGRLAEERFGGLDAVFANAGTLGTLAPVTELSPEAWDHTLRTNLTSAFLLARQLVPRLRARGGGSLVFTSTFVGHTAGFPGMAAYAASKAGLVGLTKALACELAGDGIRVNALLPGGTDTPMGRVVADSPEALAGVARLHALGRLASPEEIARSALYLASDASSFTTGTALLVDGGVSVQR